MNKTAILAEAKQANLPAEVMDQVPTCNVAGKTINSGARAKCFAAYMRIHTFESTGGKTYSQMGRYLTKSGKDTNDPTLAAVDPKTQRPIENAARNLWVTETALTNALNTSFFAEQVAMFGIVVGIRVPARRDRIRRSSPSRPSAGSPPARRKAAKRHRPGFRSPSSPEPPASHGGPALPALRVFPRRRSGGAPM